MTTRDTVEMNLVSQVFDFAKSLAELRLSDIALALYSAYILLQHGTYIFLLKFEKILTVQFFCRSTGITRGRTSPKFESSCLDRPSPRAD